jgi:hypothetical protein
MRLRAAAQPFGGEQEIFIVGALCSRSGPPGGRVRPHLSPLQISATTVRIGGGIRTGANRAEYFVMRCVARVTSGKAAAETIRASKTVSRGTNVSGTRGRGGTGINGPCNRWIVDPRGSTGTAFGASPLPTVYRTYEIPDEWFEFRFFFRESGQNCGSTAHLPLLRNFLRRRRPYRIRPRQP